MAQNVVITGICKNCDFLLVGVLVPFTSWASCEQALSGV